MSGVNIVERELERSGLLIAVSGDLDIATAPVLRERLAHAVATGARRLVLDLSDVSFMDSVALAVILFTRRELGDGGRLAVVTAPGGYPRLVLEIAGIPACLDCFEDTDHAVAQLAWS